jgi:hypothetical protein
MPNDAKLGLVAGVSLVLAVAIFFVRKDVSPDSPPIQVPRAAAPASGVSRARPTQQVSGLPLRPPAAAEEQD